MRASWEALGFPALPDLYEDNAKGKRSAKRNDLRDSAKVEELQRLMRQLLVSFLFKGMHGPMRNCHIKNRIVCECDLGSMTAGPGDFRVLAEYSAGYLGDLRR